MTRLTTLVQLGVAVTVVAGYEAVAHACPICFQIEDAHVTSGIRAAVGVLMAVTVTVLAPVVVFAVRFARRERRG